MKLLLPTFAFALFSSIFAGGCVVTTRGSAQVSGGWQTIPAEPVDPVIVAQPPPPPPPPPLPPPPPPPSPSHVWIEGHWAFRAGSWVWIQGNWYVRPAQTTRWVPGGFVQLGNGQWQWQPGHWQ
jgi:hypothetical protein